jgi:hypothetical protein
MTLVHLLDELLIYSQLVLGMHKPVTCVHNLPVAVHTVAHPE